MIEILLFSINILPLSSNCKGALKIISPIFLINLKHCIHLWYNLLDLSLHLSTFSTLYRIDQVHTDSGYSHMPSCPACWSEQFSTPQQHFLITVIILPTEVKSFTPHHHLLIVVITLPSMLSNKVTLIPAFTITTTNKMPQIHIIPNHSYHMKYSEPSLTVSNHLFHSLPLLKPSIIIPEIFTIFHLSQIFHGYTILSGSHPYTFLISSSKLSTNLHS